MINKPWKRMDGDNVRLDVQYEADNSSNVGSYIIMAVLFVLTIVVFCNLGEWISTAQGML